MTVAGTGCIRRVSSLPPFEPTDGGDLESEPESPAPTVFINTRAFCTRLQSRAPANLFPSRLCEAVAQERAAEEEADGFRLLRVVDNLQLVAFSEGQVRRRP